jgi:hypothetical protein
MPMRGFFALACSTTLPYFFGTLRRRRRNPSLAVASDDGMQLLERDRFARDRYRE